MALVAKNADLLAQLQRVQDVRLSANPPAHFASIAKPSDEEMELAQKVRDNLVEMSAKVQPRFVVSSEGIRKALGSTDLPAAGGSDVTATAPTPAPAPAAPPPPGGTAALP